MLAINLNLSLGWHDGIVELYMTPFPRFGLFSFHSFILHSLDLQPTLSSYFIHSFDNSSKPPGTHLCPVPIPSLGHGKAALLLDAFLSALPTGPLPPLLSVSKLSAQSVAGVSLPPKEVFWPLYCNWNLLTPYTSKPTATRSHFLFTLPAGGQGERRVYNPICSTHAVLFTIDHFCFKVLYYVLFIMYYFCLVSSSNSYFPTFPVPPPLSSLTSGLDS